MRESISRSNVTMLKRIGLAKLFVALRHPSLFFTYGKETRIVRSVQMLSDDIIRRARSTYEYHGLDGANFVKLLDYLEHTGRSELARFDSRLDNPYYLALYILIRWLRPGTVVETGVSLGVSSKIVLSALRDNGAGTLYSIDMPNAKWIDEKGTLRYDLVPKGYATGYVVPRNLKRRWNLIVGDSRAILPIVLDRIGPIDVFIHDSEHSYKHMMFEFSSAWPFIGESGLLVSDDEDYNSAFSEFVGSVDGRISRTFIKNSDGHKYGLVWRKTLEGGLPAAQNSLWANR